MRDWVEGLIKHKQVQKESSKRLNKSSVFLVEKSRQAGGQLLQKRFFFGWGRGEALVDVKWNKPDRERQILWDLIYRWNLKKYNKLVTKRSRLRYREQASGYQWGEGRGMG